MAPIYEEAYQACPQDLQGENDRQGKKAEAGADVLQVGASSPTLRHLLKKHMSNSSLGAEAKARAEVKGAGPRALARVGDKIREGKMARS